MRSVWPLAAAAVLALIGPSARAQNEVKPKADVKVEEKAFKSIDGVKLQGQFYKTNSTKGKDAPTVLVLHGYGQKTDDAAWDDTAKTLAEFYNVFRFDFRGHGKSTDIEPSDFWDPKYPTNRQFVTIQPPLKPETKNTIKFTDFKVNYYPMLVQDLAAARNELDRMNDANLVNTSNLYIVAAGDMAPLTLFFIASEWLREKKKPNALQLPPVPFVSPGRPRVANSDAAGEDYAGCVFLGPGRPLNTPAALSYADLKSMVISNYALKLRNETAMAFIYGAKDPKGAAATSSFLNEVLMANAKTGPGGTPLLKPDLLFSVKIDSTALTGVKLLGNNLGTETQLLKFIKDISDKERKAKTWLVREWEKPVYVDVRGFGAIK